MRTNLLAGIGLMAFGALAIYLTARPAARPTHSSGDAPVSPLLAISHGDGMQGDAGPEQSSSAGHVALEVSEPIVISPSPDALEHAKDLNPIPGVSVGVAPAEEALLPPALPTLEKTPRFMPYADDDGPPLGDDLNGHGGRSWWSWLVIPACPAGMNLPLSWRLWFDEALELLRDLSGQPMPAHRLPALNNLPDDHPLSRLGLPIFREDPNYHQRYPSCPHTGSCPLPQPPHQLPPLVPVTGPLPMPR